MDTALARCRCGVTRNPCVTDEEGHPLENEDDWGTIFQARVEGPRHHQHEDILRFVQKAPDDIRWTIDKTEFDDLLALKKDSEFHMVPTGAPGVWVSPFLFNAYRALLEGGAVPDHLLKVELFLSPRPLTSMTMEGLFDHLTHFAS